MFLALVLALAQVAAPSPPLLTGEADELGVRILIANGGVRMVGALARTRDVPLEDVFLLDEQLTKRAAEIAVDAGLLQRISVYTIPAWRDLAVVNIESFKSDERVQIFVSPLLLEYSDAQGRDGMLAHEIAHMVESCGPNPETRAAEDACEQQVDLRSARYVGKHAAIRGLCQLMASAWYWRYTTDASHIIERIKRLHHADIP